MSNTRAALSLVVTASVAVGLVWWSGHAFGISSPVFAFLANWIAMSWVAFNGRYLTHRMPVNYYAPHGFEQAGRIYEVVGIRLFKALVRRAPLAIFSPTLRFPKEKTAEGLRTLQEEMRNAETGHLVIQLLVVVSSLVLALLSHAEAAGWLLLFSIPINVYPIMLQRYNRIKLDEVLAGQVNPPRKE